MASPGPPPPPPAFPDRPDLFDEVEWGPLPTDNDIRHAYRIWGLQDCILGWQRQRAEAASPDLGPEDGAPETCLVRNVYESLMSNLVLPLSEEQQDEWAQWRVSETISHENPEEEPFLSHQNWTYAEIFSRDDPDAASNPKITERIKIDGKDINSTRWETADLEAHLQRRGLDSTGTVSELKQRLFHDEYDRLRLRGINIDMGSKLPRQDLPDWGISRVNDFMLRISTEAEFSPVEMYTWAILLSPYNPAYWTSRAYLYYQMGHFDFALGDAYRAQLLCEVLVNPLKRNTQPGLYVRAWDAVERHILQIKFPDLPIKPVGPRRLTDQVKLLRGANGINCFIPHVRRALHHIVCLSLLGLQCWSDYEALEADLLTKVALKERDRYAIEKRQTLLKDFVQDSSREKRDDRREFFYESHYGYVFGEPPLMCQPIVRSSEKVLRKINKEIIGRSQTTRLNAPKIEVRRRPGRDLGVFAKEDIPSGEIIYVDEPSIRGHLPDLRMPQERSAKRSGPLVENRCENCQRVVPGGVWETEVFRRQAKENMDSTRSRGVGCGCNLAAEPLSWCFPPSSADDEESEQPPAADLTSRSTRSRTRKRTAEADDENDSGDEERQAKKIKTERPSCLEIASALYHFRACGRDWSWLYDSMRPVLWPPTPIAEQSLHYSNEKHGTILSLMLREVFDITLHRREADKKPYLLAYEIDELLPLMGAGEGLEDQLFPFSYAANIRVPFDILQCLGVDIFRDLTFDTWVIQAVLRTLLINAIPWDGDRRLKDVVDTPESKDFRHQGLIGKPKSEYPRARPSIKNLYIFPGVSMFNHGCFGINNVMCDWDTAVPNRMILWTSRPIRKDEELCIQYTPQWFEEGRAQRLFGYKGCECCHPENYEDSASEDHTGGGHGGENQTSESSMEPDSSEQSAAPPPQEPYQRPPQQAAHTSQRSAITIKEESSPLEEEKDHPPLEGDEESSEPFEPEQAPTPRPEDEGEYDEADFEETPVEVREHSGSPMNERQAQRHANDLRIRLRAERALLPSSRLGTESTTGPPSDGPSPRNTRG